MYATTFCERRQGPSRRNGRPKTSGRGKVGLVLLSQVPLDKICPSPENEALYRPVDPADPEIIALAQSIRERGVREPLVVTVDGYILSGHRRYAAAKLAGLTAVPCRTENVRRELKGKVNPEFLRLLCEYNRQRVKSFDEKFREEAVSANPEVAYQSLIEHREERSRLDLDTLDIREEKPRKEISKAKWPFLEAIRRVIVDRQKFWPLSDRQIHYALLNDPPLIHASKPDSTYRNNATSYKALTELLTRARVATLIPMRVIQDATRPVVVWNVHRDVQGFIRGQVDGFCKGYWRDLDAIAAEPYRDHRREKHRRFDHPARGGAILHPLHHRPRLLLPAPALRHCAAVQEKRQEPTRPVDAF